MKSTMFSSKKFAALSVIAIFSTIYVAALPPRQVNDIIRRGSGGGGPGSGKDFSVRVTQDTARMTLVAWNNATAAFKFNAGVSPWPHIRASFLGKNNGEAGPDSNSVPPAGGFSGAIALTRIIEFNDTIPLNASSSFVDLRGRGSRWSALTLSNTTGPNNTVIRQAFTTFSAPAEYPGFTANFSVEYSGTAVSIPLKRFLQQFRPSEIKYSFGFAGFDYKYENSSLALVHGIWTARVVRQKMGGNATNSTAWESRKFVDFDGSAYFKWVESVQTSDGTAQITALPTFYSIADVNIDVPTFGATDMTVEKNENLSLAVFKLQLNNTRPTSFYWDPTVGVQDPAEVIDPISGSLALDTSSTTTMASSTASASATSTKTSTSGGKLSKSVMLPAHVVLAFLCFFFINA